MNTLRRNKQTLYHCKRENKDGITQYKEPILKRVNYQPISSEESLESIGEVYSMYLRVKCIKSEGIDFNSGDKCYVYVDKPETHDLLCDTADYIVDSKPIHMLNSSEIILRRLI